MYVHRWSVSHRRTIESLLWYCEISVFFFFVCFSIAYKHQRRLGGRQIARIYVNDRVIYYTRYPSKFVVAKVIQRMSVYLYVYVHTNTLLLYVCRCQQLSKWKTFFFRPVIEVGFFARNIKHNCRTTAVTDTAKCAIFLL